MRGLLVVTGSLLLVACDNGVPPPGQEPLRESSPQVAVNEVELRRDGLVAGAEAFYFAAGENEVTAALSRAIGEPEGQSTNEECGAGPMSIAVFPGGLRVNFQRGSLVGWTQLEPSETISVVGDVQVGSDREVASGADSYAAIEGSTLGEEFSLGQIGGLIEEDKVSILYAGKQCFFR